MIIECGFEAGETFQRLISHLCGYCVDIVVDGRTTPTTFHLVGPDHYDGDYASLRVRAWDEETSEPTGDEFTVIAARVYVH